MGYYGRSVGKAQSIVEKMAVPVFGSETELLDFSDAVCFCVSDSAIADVSKRTAAFLFSDSESSLSQDVQDARCFYAFHMSGAFAADEIKGAFPCKFSLHPLRAFAKVEDDLSDTTFALEIDKGCGLTPRCTDAIDEFASSLGTKLVRLRSDQKTRYHAAAVMASNLFIPLYYEANEVLKQIGLDDDTLLLPLIHSAIENIEQLGVDHALTGPIARGDVLTVKRHLEELLPEQKRMYVDLSRYALKLSPASAEKKEKVAHCLEEVER